MKFISRNQNLRIVLRPGIPPEPLAGQPGRAGVYAKFQQGVLNVSDDNEQMINDLKAHPGFGTDYVCDEIDPYTATRKNIEPEHDIVEINYGHVGRAINPKKKSIPPELQSAVMAMAKDMAQKIAADAVKSALAELIPALTAVKKESTPAVKGKPGRPRKLTTNSAQGSEAEAGTGEPNE